MCPLIARSGTVQQSNGYVDGEDRNVVRLVPQNGREVSALHQKWLATNLQAGGQGFEPPHVHQLNLRSLNHLRCFFFCTSLVQNRDNRDNRPLLEIWKSEPVADSLRFLEAYLRFLVLMGTEFGHGLRFVCHPEVVKITG